MSSAVIDITLTEDAWSLLQVYAFPHMKLDTKIKLVGSARVAFDELREKGLVREGVGRAVAPMGPGVDLKGTETAEEFEAALKPMLVDTPGWVITEKAIAMFLQAVEPVNREKAERVLRTFIADIDPAVKH